MKKLIFYVLGVVFCFTIVFANTCSKCSAMLLSNPETLVTGITNELISNRDIPSSWGNVMERTNTPFSQIRWAGSDVNGALQIRLEDGIAEFFTYNNDLRAYSRYIFTSPGKIATNRGIRIGDNESEIIKIYGKADFTGKSYDKSLKKEIRGYSFRSPGGRTLDIYVDPTTSKICGVATCNDA